MNDRLNAGLWPSSAIIGTPDNKIDPLGSFRHIN